MSEVETWSPTAASNNAAAPNGFPEGMLPADLNNCGRELMAAFARVYANPEFLNVSFGFTVSRIAANQVRIAGVDQTSIYAIGVRFKITGGAAAQYGFVTAAAFSAGNTNLTVLLDSGSVDAATNKIAVHIARSARSAAFREVGITTGQVPLVENIRTLATRSPLEWKKTTADQSITAASSTQITLDGGANDYIDITGADGAKDWNLSLVAIAEKITNFSLSYDFQVHVGVAGTKADLVVFKVPMQQSASAPATFRTTLGLANLRLSNVAAGHRLSFSLFQVSVGGAGAGWKILGSGTIASAFMFATVEEAF